MKQKMNIFFIGNYKLRDVSKKKIFKIISPKGHFWSLSDVIRDKKKHSFLNLH